METKQGEHPYVWTFQIYVFFIRTNNWWATEINKHNIKISLIWLRKKLKINGKCTLWNENKNIFKMHLYLIVVLKCLYMHGKYYGQHWSNGEADGANRMIVSCSQWN